LRLKQRRMSAALASDASPTALAAASVAAVAGFLATNADEFAVLVLFFARAAASASSFYGGAEEGAAGAGALGEGAAGRGAAGDVPAGRGAADNATAGRSAASAGATSGAAGAPAVLSSAQAPPPPPALALLDVCFGNLLGFALVLALSASGTALGAAGAPARYVRLLGFVPLLMGIRTALRRALKWWVRRRQKAAHADFGGGGGGDAEAAALGPRAGESSEALLRNSEVLSAAAVPLPASHLPPRGPRAPRYSAHCARALELGAFCLRPAVLEVAAATAAGGAEEVAVYLPLLAAGPLLRSVVTAAVLLACVLCWQALALALVRLPPVARSIERVGDAAEPVLLVAIGLYCLVGSVALPVAGGG